MTEHNASDKFQYAVSELESAARQVLDTWIGMDRPRTAVVFLNDEGARQFDRLQAALDTLSSIKG